MSQFKPTAEERDTLKRAVLKYAHEPVKARLLSLLDSEETEYSIGTPEWNEMKGCISKYHLHAQAEAHRNPNHKPTRLQLAKADAVTRKFTPNFS
jgi:hypothetical protein